MLNAFSERILEDDTELLSTLLRGSAEAVSQDRLRTVCFCVQTQQRCRKILNMFLNSVIHKIDQRFTFYSKICHKQESESITQSFYATSCKEPLQPSWEQQLSIYSGWFSYTVCRRKAVIIPAGGSHHWLECSLVSTPFPPWRGSIHYETCSFTNQPGRSQRKQPSFAKPDPHTATGKQAGRRTFSGRTARLVCQDFCGCFLLKTKISPSSIISIP